MNKITNIIKNFSLCLFLLLMSICLVSCGTTNPSIELNKNTKSNIDNTISYLTENVYNKSDILGQSTTYSVAEAKAKISDFNYYIEIATLQNFEEFDNIKIGSESFNKDKEILLSVGNNNFIKDKVWYVKNDKLYVAAPIIAFELTNNNTITINDTEIKLTDIETQNKINFSSVSFNNSSINTATKVQDKEEYNLTINNSNYWLGLTYPNAKSTDIALTKKTYTYNNGETNISYGLTAVENVTNYPVAFYPITYNPDGGKITETLHKKYQNSSIEYQVYIPGTGIAKTKLNINLNYSENT